MTAREIELIEGAKARIKELSREQDMVFDRLKEMLDVEDDEELFHYVFNTKGATEAVSR